MDDESPEYVEHLAELLNLQRLHKNRLFLSRSTMTNKVRILARDRWAENLTDFCCRHGIDWKLKPHQLRRTFAVFAARNAFSDLRYLRVHLKHFMSNDMTVLYAHNKKQDAELYDMILDDMEQYNMDNLEHWIQEDSLLAGGAGKAIMRTRNTKDVAALRDHYALLKETAKNVHIRGTGTSWCSFT